MKMKTNLELWEMCRQVFPNFKSRTAQGTAELFTSRGYEAVTRTDANIVNEFYGLSVKIFLNLINESNAKNPLEEAGFTDSYTNMGWGDAVVQRMAVETINPVTPGWKGLTPGDAPDPFVYRPANASERFWKSNGSYQSLLSIPDESLMRSIFIADNGMSNFISAQMRALENGYTIQRYNEEMEALNAILNPTAHPLKDTQKVDVHFSAVPTKAELIAFVKTVRKTVQSMKLAPQTGAYNSAGFETSIDTSRLKLLVRAGITTDLLMDVMASAFNQEDLALNVDVVEVANFGGLVPYKEAAYTTRLYARYDKLGSVTGFAEGETPKSKETIYKASECYWKDPNEDVFAMLVDKGIVFRVDTSEMVSNSIFNPRGLYTNIWVSKPNYCIGVDHYYTCVVFKQGVDVPTSEPNPVVVTNTTANPVNTKAVTV